MLKDSQGVVGSKHENVHVDVAGSIAHVRISGWLDRAGLMRAKARTIGQLAEIGEIGGWLVDYGGAEVCLTRADLAAVFDGPESAGQMAMPAAMLVRPVDLPLFNAHIWDVAWLGVVRQVFTSRRAALGWLTSQARTALEVRALHQQV